MIKLIIFKIFVIDQNAPKTHTHTPTHHSELADHSRGPADVYTFIHHCYKQRVWVSVNPVERCTLWVTHPDAGSVSNVSTELSQRAAVQPEGGRHRESTHVCVISTQWQMFVTMIITRICGVSNLITVSKRLISGPSSRPLRMPPFPTTTQRRHLSDVLPGWRVESEFGSFKGKFAQRIIRDLLQKVMCSMDIKMHFCFIYPPE